MYKKVLSSVLVFLVLLSILPGNPIQASAASIDINGHWAEEDLNKWIENGILLGYQDGTIKPDNNITRAEFVTIINKVLGFFELGKEQFSDVQDTKWYSGEILKAREAGYIAGYENNIFKPENYITRQEAVVIMANVFEFKSSNDYLSKFTDGDSVKDYAKEAVNALVERGYIAGYNDGTFRPDSFITRAETIKILSRIVEALYNNKGSYTTGRIFGNALINTEGVVLKDTVIDGDLYLSPGIQEGDVTLDGVDVKGTVYVNGGGSNSIHINNSKANRIVVKKKGNQQVRIVTSGETSVEETIVKSGAKLEEKDLKAHGFKKVIVDKDLSTGSIIEFIGDFEQVDALAEGAVLQTRQAKMRLRILGHGIKINGETIENSSETYVVDGEEISIETEEPQPSETPEPQSTPVASDSTQTTSKPGSTSAPAEQWKLVWSDEFNGTEINMNNWSFDDPTNGRWNNEIQSYTQNNAYIQDGSLIIEARKEDITEPSGQTYNYSSAKLITKGKQSWTYGKFEIRAKMPIGKGIWPAIWMMPEDEPFYGTWPKCGEIDIMEFLGHEPNKIYGTIHFGEPHKESQGTYTLPAGQSFSDDYHIYSIEWEPGEIRWYLDGKLYHKANDWYSRDPYLADDYTYPAPFDQDFFLIMNISVGGNWPGNPDETTVFPQQMAVDYVRVYQKSNYPHREKPISEESTAREPLADGNYIYNGGFDVDDPEATGVDGVPYTSYWTFLEGPGGEAALNVDEGVMHVQIDKGGTTDYSVQLLQAPVHLEKGAKYKASFDMKAQGERNVKLKIGGDGDRGWTDYAAIPAFIVSTEMQTYEFEFTMKHDTDVKARFEFNMGLNDNDIWIDNVKLIKTEDAPEIDPSEVARPPLVSGNYIYNGTFDQGENRMGFWKFIVGNGASADYYIGSGVNERRFETRIKNGGNSKDAIKLVQSGINIELSKSYKVSFEASAKAKRTIDVEIVSNQSNSVIYSTTIEIDKVSKVYEFEFTMDKDSDKNGELRFNLGGNISDVYIDNVVMKKTSSDDIEGNLLVNGGFSGLLGWKYEALEDGSALFDNTDEQFKADISSVGNAGWHVQLYQDNVPLEQGQTYEVSFDAKSTVDRKILVQMQQVDVWTQYFYKEVQITGELQTFKYEFTMDKPSDSASRFSFALGSPDDGVTTYPAHELIIDNVVVRKVVNNIIKNGTFDNGKENWSEYWGGPWEDSSEGEGDGTATGSCEVVSGELVINITKVGNKDYIPQIKQENLFLEEGVTYTVSFKARADVPRSIKADILDATYNWYGGSTFDLTTEYEIYTFEFTSSKSVSDGTLTINLGTIPDKDSAATTVYLDDIQITKK